MIGSQHRFCAESAKCRWHLFPVSFQPLVSCHVTRHGVIGLFDSFVDPAVGEERNLESRNTAQSASSKSMMRPLSFPLDAYLVGLMI